LSTDGSVTQGVLTPNATVLATQNLVRQSASVEGGHANQLGVQMRLTRVTPQPGHPLDHNAAQRAASKFSFSFAGCLGRWQPNISVDTQSIWAFGGATQLNLNV
jgi:hypothetical protein